MTRRVLDPKCDHRRKGIVTSSVDPVKGEAHAATNCCDRPECIEDAKGWVNQTVLADKAIWIADKP